MSFKRFIGKHRMAVAALALVTLFAGAAIAGAAVPVLRMATTTSTDNTGLLDYLAPIFMADTGIEVQWVSVGTGKALEYGRNGDVDVVLTHDPEAERAFVGDGFGIEPKQVMFNDFVLLGPASDPAGIKGKPIVEAMKIIAGKKTPLVSRADKSGTHMAELRLLKAAGVPDPDKEDWFVQTGQRMLDTINIAGERQGYALADRGTFIKYEANHKGNPPLVIIVEGDDSLKNQYSVIPVNPAKHPSVRIDLARQYADWITHPKVQRDIEKFKLEGKQLFFPNAEL